MNKINHHIFSISTGILFFDRINILNISLLVLFTILVNIFLDYFHGSIEKAEKQNKPWYHRRTWIEEPLGFVFIAIPTALLFSFINKIFLILILVPYGTHILLDYLCIFETCPLAPLSYKIKKREGLGIFIPDDLFRKSENSRRWEKRVRDKGIKGISENFFTIFNFILLIISFVKHLRI